MKQIIESLIRERERKSGHSRLENHKVHLKKSTQMKHMYQVELLQGTLATQDQILTFK